MIPEEILIIAEKYLRGEASQEEERQLHSWYNAAPEQERELVITEYPVTAEDFGKKTLDEMLQVIHRNEERGKRSKTFLVQIAVAASLLAAFGLLIFWPSDKDLQVLAVSQQHSAADLPAGTNSASLQLADGTVILLDSAADGWIRAEGSSLIKKDQDGELSYTGGDEVTEEILYNTLRTPRGGQYQLLLPDGTRVWLNAASSLHYPTKFQKEQRVVELDGEGYFEVSPRSAQPFIVRTKDHQVEVLGTHFNINVYDDEPESKTSLIEGSIVISAGAAKTLLVPGEQANIQGDRLQISRADMQEAIAWKNGYFLFNNVDLPTLMRQISRWYDVDIIYEGKPSSERFIGEVSRSSNASELLKILELSNVQFRIEGKTIIVSQG